MKKDEIVAQQELMLQKIKEEVELYNKIAFPENQIEITSKYQPKQIKASDCVICMIEDYNTHTKKVQLFEKKEYVSWTTSEKKGNIYIGVYSNYVCVSPIKINCFSKPIIDGVEYSSNCEVIDEKNYEEMRLMAYNDGEIDPSTSEIIDSYEILQVLSYAETYYKTTEEPSEGQKKLQFSEKE